MPISPARRIAFDILLRVASEGAYASELLYAGMGDPAAPHTSPADAALATELTLGVLRWQRLLDFMIDGYLDPRKRPAADHLDIEVLLALRLAVYQLRFLERVPAHAAVNESVELVKSARKRSAAPLVNAVLRRVARDANLPQPQLERQIEELLPPDASRAERAAILFSHPTWLVEKWMAVYGEPRTLALLQTNNRPAPLSCAVLDASGISEIAESIRQAGQQPGRQAGIAVQPGTWLRSALSIHGGNPAAMQARRAGQVSFQDEASQMVANLVAALPGQRVLDVCAAPGGKTTLLARAVAPGGTVIAADLHEHRLRSLRELLSRNAAHNVFILAMDAGKPLPFGGTFDRILVDAPCSGTGTLARNPEIRWRLHPQAIAVAAGIQTSMLHQALSLLAPGGRLVYATCSLEPEENEEVVRDALALNTGANIKLVSGESALQAHLRDNISGAPLFDRDGFFRTFPSESHTDGFFAAVLERSL